MEVLLFVFGLAIGSFLNVVSLRYNPEKFLFSLKAVGGRSRCMHCRNELKAYELIPVFSFLFLRGRCGRCRAKLSWQYPIVEVLSGFIFVFVPARLATLYYLPITHYYLFSTVCILSLLSLLLMAVIDFRLRIVPDEINILLIVLGIGAAFILPSFGAAGGSTLGSYNVLLAGFSNIWLNKLLGFLAGGVGLGLLLLLTRGRGMGMGDVKLAAALGAFFGWPDVAVILGIAFVLGALAGLATLLLRKKTLKSALAFGPFLAIAAAFVFFWGQEFIRWYLGVFLG